MKHLTLFVFLTMMLFTPDLFAQPAPAAPAGGDMTAAVNHAGDTLLKKFAEKVTLGGEYHGNLNMSLTDDGNDTTETAFQTTRMYVTAKASLNKMFSIRTTLDFADFTGDATGFDSPLLGYIKYAYFEVKPMDTLKLRFGQQATPWIGTMDKVMGYRYVYKTGLDYYKWDSSADTGLSVLGEVADGIFAYHVGVFNGVGYKNMPQGESPQNLMVAARASVYPFKSMKESPLAKLGAHLYFKTDAEGEGDDNVREMMYGGALSFNHKYVDLLFEVLLRSSDDDADKGGLLLAPYLKFKYQKYSLFVTYSMFDDKNTDESWNRILAGATWDYSKKFAISLNYQSVTAKGNVKDKDSQGIFINTLFKF